jgi:hypothetical protein
MALQSKEIIAAIKRDYPQPYNAVTIKNCSDLDIEGRVKRGHQYIIGVTQRDPMQAACERYQYAIREKLKSIGFECAFSAWSFQDDELDDAITTLKELSKCFDARLDDDRMVRKLNIGKPKGEMYFVVVTIVFIPMTSVSSQEDL